MSTPPTARRGGRRRHRRSTAAPAGAPLFRVIGGRDGLDEDAVTEAVVLGLERTLDTDVAYGFRMLVDIAERSLADSPFQDPTTAVQAIDRLHDCLRQMARRPSPMAPIVTTRGWCA